MLTNPKIRKIALESAIIVGSILLAFSIDAWWDRSQQYNYQQEILRRLEEAFVTQIEILDTQIETYAERNIEPIYYFLSLDSSNLPEISIDLASTMIGNIIRPSSNVLNNDALIAIMDTITVSIEDNSELQENLVSIRRMITTLETRRESIFSHQQEAVRALGQHPEILSYINTQGPNPPDLQKSDPILAIRAALDDSDIVALAARKGFLWRNYLNDYQGMRRRSEASLELVRALIE